MGRSHSCGGSRPRGIVFVRQEGVVRTAGADGSVRLASRRRGLSIILGPRSASATRLYGIQPSLWDLPRWRLTLEYLAAFLASTATQGTIWLVFLCFLLLNPPRLRDRATLLASIGLLGLAGWAGSIYITRIDLETRLTRDRATAC